MRQLLRAGRVLDLGCGTGRMLGGGPSVIGIDLSMEMLRRARAKSHAVARADGHHLPFASDAFDAVTLAQGVIRYMEPDKAFAEIARVLAPGGRCAVHQFGHGLRLKEVVRRRRSKPDALALLDVNDLLGPARAQGFRVTQVELFRTLKRYPYAVKIHARVPKALSDALWNHCVLHFQKP